MNSSFINPTITRASELGVGLYEDSHLVELFTDNSLAEKEIVILAIYRQVLGNIHLMESDRLNSTESLLINSDITIREFIRHLAYSELYRGLFFENYTSLRTIELNFKHFLGRAPHSYEEVVQHIHILQSEGYEAEIDSYLDSEEYLNNFGENIVPYYQGYKTQAGKNVIGFTHLFHLLRGSCSSDRSTFSGNRPRLQKALIKNHPSSIIPLSTLPVSWKEPGFNQLTAKSTSTSTSAPIAPSKPPASSVQPFRPNLQPKPPESSVISDRTIWKNQYNVLANANPIRIVPGSSDTDLENVINATYKQILGNAHIMESERLTIAESQLKRDEISVRDFVRWIAKSELYKSRFIDNCPRYRSHELNFKHLLGRAPDSYQETIAHSQTLDNQGYEADIDSYIDSEEYQRTFGENIVPYYRGYKTQMGKGLLGYTNMFKMLESISTSDKSGVSGNSPRLVKSIIHNNPNGNAPVTDINKLLEEVFKPKNTEPEYKPYIPQPQDKSQALETEITELETQLAELRSFATIGAAGDSKWQSYYIDIKDTSTSSRSSQSQQERVETLKQEIAQARSLASLGEIRLNKWRDRLFF